MPQYRLKTVALAAVQFTGESAQAEALVTAMFSNVSPEYHTLDGQPAWTGNLLVQTADALEVVHSSDYILTRPDNSRFVVTASDFASLYEPIPE